MLAALRRRGCSAPGRLPSHLRDRIPAAGGQRLVVRLHDLCSGQGVHERCAGDACHYRVRRGGYQHAGYAQDVRWTERVFSGCKGGDAVGGTEGIGSWTRMETFSLSAWLCFSATSETSGMNKVQRWRHF